MSQVNRAHESKGCFKKDRGLTRLSWIILLKKATAYTVSEDNKELFEEVFKNQIYEIQPFALAATKYGQIRCISSHFGILM